jgi:hypothetical protein
VEVNAFYVGIVDASFCGSQSFKDPDRPLSGGGGDRGLSDDLANLLQPAMRVLMRMRVRRTLLVRFRLTVRVRVMLLIPVAMRLMPVLLLRSSILFPEFLPRQLFFAGSDHVDFCGADAAAIHARDLQPGIMAKPKGGDGLRQELWRYSGIDQGAKKHIAADPGEAL